MVKAAGATPSRADSRSNELADIELSSEIHETPHVRTPIGEIKRASSEKMSFEDFKDLVKKRDDSFEESQGVGIFGQVTRFVVTPLSKFAFDVRAYEIIEEKAFGISSMSYEERAALASEAKQRVAEDMRRRHRRSARFANILLLGVFIWFFVANVGSSQLWDASPRGAIWFDEESSRVYLSTKNRTQLAGFRYEKDVSSLSTKIRSYMDTERTFIIVITVSFSYLSLVFFKAMFDYSRFDASKFTVLLSTGVLFVNFAYYPENCLDGEEVLPFVLANTASEFLLGVFCTLLGVSLLRSGLDLWNIAEYRAERKKQEFSYAIKSIMGEGSLANAMKAVAHKVLQTAVLSIVIVCLLSPIIRIAQWPEFYSLDNSLLSSRCERNMIPYVLSIILYISAWRVIHTLKMYRRGKVEFEIYNRSFLCIFNEEAATIVESMEGDGTWK